MFRPRLFLVLLLVLLTACANAPQVITEPTVGPTTAPPPAITIIDSTATPDPAASAATPPPTDNGEPAAPVVVGPDNFPTNVNPLTGLTVSDPSVLTRHPLAIKVSNFPRYVRPQAGLSFADNVWEHYAEGGTTRFTAIFLANAPAQIGPLRSARLIDTVLPEMLNAALITSGGSTGTMGRLARKPWYPLIISDLTGYNQCPPLCRESDDTNALFTNPLDLWALIPGIANAPASTSPVGLAFSVQVPTSTTPGNTLRIDYSGEANTEWRYDAGTGRYLRFSDVIAGVVEPLTDVLNNQQIAADNVVVLFVNHVVDHTIPEDYFEGGLSGYFATEIQLWGTGRAIIFRDGVLVPATWSRLDAGMVRFVDENGQSIPFKPGVTWFQTVGLTSDVNETGSGLYIRHRSPLDRGTLIGVEDFLTQTAEAPPPPDENGEAPTEEATPSP